MNDITVESLADVQGWFDFAPFYDEVAALLPFGFYIAELGPWLGKSTIYLAGAVRRNKKIGTIYAVDTWLGSPGEDVFQFVIGGLPGGALEEFRRNVKRFDVDCIIEVERDSLVAAAMMPNKHLDFVFFDTTHTEEHLQREIDAWLPKVESNRFVGGHDIGIEGVRKAVESRFTEWSVSGPCWKARVEAWKQP